MKWTLWYPIWWPPYNWKNSVLCFPSFKSHTHIKRKVNYSLHKWHLTQIHFSAAQLIPGKQNSSGVLCHHFSVARRRRIHAASGESSLPTACSKITVAAILCKYSRHDDKQGSQKQIFYLNLIFLFTADWRDWIELFHLELKRDALENVLASPETAALTL